MTGTRARALAVLACLAVALALTAPAALGTGELYLNDVSHFELPRDELVAARLRAGEGLPRWLPGVWGGAPALASQELALLYPPNDLLLLLAPERALAWGLALHLALGALGAAALARRLGARGPAALVAGFVYAFGGFLVSMSQVLVYARTGAWLPWAVLGLVGASAGEASGLALAVLALLGTYLGGDPFGAALAGIAGLLVALVTGQGRARRAVATLLAAAALSAALAAAQLLPALLATRETVRGEGMTYAGATAFSLWPPELAGLLVPFVFGAAGAPETAWYELVAPSRYRAWAEVLYVGPIALVLAVVAFGRGGREARPRLRDPLVRAGLALGLVFLPLALGGATPLYRLFYALPGVSLFRYPAKLFLYASLGLALLAGSGTQVVLDDATGKLRHAARTALAVLGTLLLLASNAATVGAASFGEWIDALGSAEVSGKRALAALGARLAHAAFVALGGAAVLAKKQGSARRRGIALAALVAIDLVLGTRATIVVAPRASVRRPPAAAALLAERAREDGAPARVLPSDAAGSDTPEDLEDARSLGLSRGSFEGLVPDVGLAAGVLSQRGFVSDPPLRPITVAAEAGALLRAHGLDHAQAAALRGARYVVALEAEARDYGEVVAPLPGGRALVRVRGAPAWAQVYGRARVVRDREAAREALRSLDPAGEVVVEAPGEPVVEGTGDARVAGSRVKLVSFAAERVELEVETPEPGWLVLRESFARGWSATVRGEGAAIFPANLAFRAVKVPAGASRVVMSYETPGATVGAVVSALALLLCGALALGWRRRSAKAIA